MVRFRLLQAAWAHERLLEIQANRTARSLLRILPFFTSVLAGVFWLDVLNPSTHLALVLRAGIFTVLAGALWVAWLAKRRREAPGIKAEADFERRLEQGRNGEVWVGQEIQRRLAPFGYWVANNFDRGRGDVDHVVVGPGGVFAVETKTWTQNQADEEPFWDGDNLKLGNYIKNDAIIQVKEHEQWVKQLLEQKLGRPVKVQPVLVLPGLFVRTGHSFLKSVWVLAPGAFCTTVSRARAQLSPREVIQISDILEAARLQQSRPRAS